MMQNNRNLKAGFLKQYFGILMLLYVMGSSSALAQLTVQIPFRLVRDRKIMVDAEVNGVHGNFLLDSGAPCALTDAFAEKAGVTGGNEVGMMDANGRQTASNLSVWEKLQMGKTMFTNVTAMRLPQHHPLEQFGVDGIIGYTLMNQAIVKFDLRNHLFTFTTQLSEVGIINQEGISLLPDRFLSLLPVELGHSAKDTVMFDLGASDLYDLSERAYQRIQADKDIRTLASGIGSLSIGAAGVERPMQKHRVAVGKLTIGQTVFSGLQTVTVGNALSRIGTELLEYGEVVVDFPHRKFYFLPYKPGVQTIATPKEWNVVLTVVRGRIVAGLVWSDADTEMKGGEQIVSVEGRRMESLTPELLSFLQKQLRTKDQLTIAYRTPDGKEMETIIRKR